MFGLDKHHEHRCSYNEFENTFTHHLSRTTIPVAFKKGHLYVEWSSSQVLFTKSELIKLHDRFSHPAVDSLMNLLKRASPENVSPETRIVLQDIAERCDACQIYAPKPARFKVSLPEDNWIFNHEIQVDLFWVEGKAALHIMDRGTRYSVVRFLKQWTAGHVCNITLESWVTIFTGFPNVTAVD